MDLIQKYLLAVDNESERPRPPSARRSRATKGTRQAHRRAVRTGHRGLGGTKLSSGTEMSGDLCRSGYPAPCSLRWRRMWQMYSSRGRRN